MGDQDKRRRPWWRRRRLLTVVGKPSVIRTEAGQYVLELEVLNVGPVKAGASVVAKIDGSSIVLSDPSIVVGVGEGPVTIQLQIPPIAGFSEGANVSVNLVNQHGLGASVGFGPISGGGGGWVASVGLVAIAGFAGWGVGFAADVWDWPFGGGGPTDTTAEEEELPPAGPTAAAGYSQTFVLFSSATSVDGSTLPLPGGLSRIDDEDCIRCTYEVWIDTVDGIRAIDTVSFEGNNGAEVTLTSDDRPFDWLCIDKRSKKQKFVYDHVTGSTSIDLAFTPTDGDLLVLASVSAGYTHDQGIVEGCDSSVVVNTEFTPDGNTDGGDDDDVTDGDGDGHVVPADCDDADASIHPEATDIPEDGIDQDCDGVDPSKPDADADGVPDDTDNCPRATNQDQTDTDNDGSGDACDDDDDGDGLSDDREAEVGTNSTVVDTDGGGVGDGVEIDDATDPLDPDDDGTELVAINVFSGRLVPTPTGSGGTISDTGGLADLAPVSDGYLQYLELPTSAFDGQPVALYFDYAMVDVGVLQTNYDLIVLAQGRCYYHQFGPLEPEKIHSVTVGFDDGDWSTVGPARCDPGDEAEPLVPSSSDDRVDRAEIVAAFGSLDRVLIRAESSPSIDRVLIGNMTIRRRMS